MVDMGGEGKHVPKWWFGQFFVTSRRRHTGFDCDWSSDVCSSDLMEYRGRTNGGVAGWSHGGGAIGPSAVLHAHAALHLRPRGGHEEEERRDGEHGGDGVQRREIGRASCRERV